MIYLKKSLRADLKQICKNNSHIQSYFHLFCWIGRGWSYIALRTSHTNSLTCLGIPRGVCCIIICFHGRKIFRTTMPIILVIIPSLLSYGIIYYIFNIKMFLRLSQCLFLYSTQKWLNMFVIILSVCYY